MVKPSAGDDQPDIPDADSKPVTVKPAAAAPPFLPAPPPLPTPPPLTAPPTQAAAPMPGTAVAPMLPRTTPAPGPTPAGSMPQVPIAADAHPTNAGIIILQWLTYGFWGWTVLILAILTERVFADFIGGGGGSSIDYYIASAAVVLLPISLACDFLYTKQEPEHKSGAAMVVMVIHTVIFAFFGIGSLIFAVFSLVSLITGTGGGRTDTAISLYSAILTAVFYGAIFMRTLNPAHLVWIARVYRLFMLVVVGLFIILGFVGASRQPVAKNLTYGNSNNSNNSTTPSLPSTPTTSTGEQANTQGTRRPAQYTHICETAGGIGYYSQGTPNCLGSDTLDTADTGAQPGTEYSSPCKTASGTVRYVYISNDETCPSGTTLLFYNSLGGSTSGPSGGGSNSGATTD